MTTNWMVISGLVAGLSVSSSPAQAQVTAKDDARWAAWLGCWRAEDDVAGTGARLCITSRAQVGVTWLTVLGGQRVSEESRVADGVTRPIADASCAGTQSASWSTGGHRVYTKATVACGPEEARRLSGVAFLVEGPVLVDVQAIDERGTTSVRVRRYRRTSNQSMPDGTTAPRPTGMAEAAGISRPWTVPDIVEATALIPADGLQAALVEGPAAFALTRSDLLTLGNAHVAETVIDLMVAMAYPKRFVVSHGSEPSGLSVGALGGVGWVDPFFSPILGMASLYNCYEPYGWASSSYWSQCNPYDAFAYSRYPGYYGGYYGGADPRTTGWYVTGSASTTTAGAPHLEGRVVNGRGYTQIQPVESSGPAANTGSGGTIGTSSSGDSNSGGSGVTSQGYSGSGSGGGDRTAVPRPPGAR